MVFDADPECSKEERFEWDRVVPVRVGVRGLVVVSCEAACEDRPSNFWSDDFICLSLNREANHTILDICCKWVSMMQSQAAIKCSAVLL